MHERWVGDGTDGNILTPSSSDYSSTSFSFYQAAQPGVFEGHKPSVWSWFSLPRTATCTPAATVSNQVKPSVAPGYIIVCRPPASCGRRNCTEFNPFTGQADTSIYPTGCTCFLIDWWVEGQYVTVLIQPLLGKNWITLYRIVLTPIWPLAFRQQYISMLIAY